MNDLSESAKSGYVVRLKRGNAVPILAISPTEHRYVYSSIRAFVKDTVGLSRRVTAQRRVRQGGGRVNDWYIEPLRHRDYRLWIEQLSK